MRTIAIATAATMLACASAAQAAPVYPGTSWGSISGENTNGGSAAITATAPRSGTGSVELTGDRARFTNGNYYDTSGRGLYSVSSVLGLTFDWMIASGSTNPYNPDYTPALRLHIFDPSTGKRSELIWEGAYNGTYGNTMRDTWYSTSIADNFYQNVTGSGVTLLNGSQVNQSVAAWTATYGSNAVVTALSVGVGSGATAAYHAFADNVTLTRTTGIDTFNFEVAGATAAVPEPAAWATIILGMGLVGGAMRRRRGVTTRVSFAA